ncbi:MAG TPA: glycerol-3-phosphate 1-O-acyltransferase PlsY [Bryobacteraceae bacterium]|nr:glycerol-3-phosphate 1-O-acyltransferase PlsY [Bryobacteraceae bacterium]
MNPYLLTAALSYLSGSIPFGYLLVRIFRGEDIRRSGSGNIGATNVSRKSPALGMVTLVLDALKGFVPVAIALSAGRRWVDPPYVLAATAACFAIVGHIFPVWLKFHGGKGVATGLGSWIGLAPKGVLVMVVVFVVMVAVFRYISLGSITAAAIFPAAARLLHDYHETPPVLGFMAASSLLIIVKHHHNIRRLLAGTENKFRQAHK